jgi:hypothetical protein
VAAFTLIEGYAIFTIPNGDDRPITNETGNPLALEGRGVSTLPGTDLGALWEGSKPGPSEPYPCWSQQARRCFRDLTTASPIALRSTPPYSGFGFESRFDNGGASLNERPNRLLHRVVTFSLGDSKSAQPSIAIEPSWTFALMTFSGSN